MNPTIRNNKSIPEETIELCSLQTAITFNEANKWNRWL